VTVDSDFSTRPRRVRLDALGLASVVVGLALLTGVLWALRDARGARAQALTELEALQSETRDLERSLARAGGGGIRERVARAELVGRASPRRILGESAHLVPDGVRIESLSVSYKSTPSISVSFVARNAAAYDVFIDALRTSGAFLVRGASAERRSGEMRGVVTIEWRETQEGR
jgi:Tfp pilus assembly protein PilN